MIRLIIITIMLIMVTGCGTLTPYNVRVVNWDKRDKSVLNMENSSPRSHKYFNCIRKLNQDGIKQSLIKQLCDSALGSID